MKFAACGHEFRAEHGKNLANIRQRAVLYPPQHQRIADPLHLDVLCAVNEPQFLRDAHGQRIAAFKYSCQHGVISFWLEVYTVCTSS